MSTASVTRGSSNTGHSGYPHLIPQPRDWDLRQLDTPAIRTRIPRALDAYPHKDVQALDHWLSTPDCFGCEAQIIQQLDTPVIRTRTSKHQDNVPIRT